MHEVVVAAGVVEVLVVEAVLWVEGCGLGLGLFHWGEVRRRAGI